jgi:PKD repeat protein/sugar lactone lactonase YvrE
MLINVSHTFQKFFISFLMIFLTYSLSLSATMPVFEREKPVTTNIEQPTAVTTDEIGTLYVTDLFGGTLHVFNKKGRYQRLTGLDKPISVAIGRDRKIYVGSKGRGSVDVFDRGLKPLFKLGIGNGEFQQPNAIATDGSGKIYVVDSKDDRVKVYKPDGSFKYSFGGSGSGNGQFHFPTSIAINESTGEILVADRKIQSSFFGDGDGARVQIFNKYGAYQDSFDHYGVLIRPMGMTVDEESNIYITDTFQNGVQVFERSGNYLGAIYNTVDPMRTPLGISLSSEKKLYIASLNTGTVEVYRSPQPGPEITIIPGFFDFGITGVGSVKETMFVVRNDGTENLVIGTISDPSMPFSKASDGCANTTLSPEDVCTIVVRFAPDELNIYSSNFSIASNDPSESLITVALNGEGGNNAPAADAGGPYTAQEGQLVILNGSGSHDVDGSLVQYAWDIDGDGGYDYASSNPKKDHVYANHGTYTVSLRVTDNLGATGEATTTATITDTAPTADFTAALKSGDAPLTVNFTDTSTGHDTPFTYAWDFDSDGSIDSAEQNPTFVYMTEGIYTVTLTITDSDGSTNSIVKTDYIKVASDLQTLSVSVDGKGFISSLPSGINCPGDCSEEYVSGTAIVLNAVPDNSNWTFTGWSGACSGTGSCSVAMDQDHTVSATFECTISFSDTLPVWAEQYILAVTCEGIMPGFEDSTFRAADMVTRSEMAAFIIRALIGEDFDFSSIPYFDDVPTPHELFRYVQRLYEEGITMGCSETNYCPDGTVNRAQMAAFIIRALYGEDFGYGTTPYFNDIPDAHWAFSYIQRLSEDGISSGYEDGAYRPAIEVNRAQMAAYLARAFLGM